MYTGDHKFVEALTLPRNPVLVIEDTDVLSRAPAKFMIWGMGDALSTKFESEAYAKARAKKKDGPAPTTAAMALADACYNGLMEHGLKAVHDVKNGIHSRDVDDVIEAVKLSSAMAFENTGCALAHALHNGLTRTGEVKGEHGEIVAYCTIIQMVYEKRHADEVSAVRTWCEKVGLPTTLDALGGPSKMAVRKAAEYAAEKDPDSRNMPEKVKAQDVLKAIETSESVRRACGARTCLYPRMRFHRPASTIWEWEIGRAPFAGEPDDLQPMHQTHARRPEGVQDGRRHARRTAEADVRPRAVQGPVPRLPAGEPAGVISSPRTFFSDIWDRYSSSLSMALLMNSEMELMPHSGWALSLLSMTTPNARSILIVTRSSRTFCPICVISPTHILSNVITSAGKRIIAFIPSP